MADLIQSYVDEVRGRLSREIGRESADLAALEIEAHLRERVLALEELGVTGLSAEIDAIRAFGDAEAISRSLAEANRPPQRRLDRAVIKTAVLAVLAFTPIAALIQPTGLIAPLLLSAAMLIALFVCSFRAQRFLPLHLGGVVLSWSLGLWLLLPFTMVNVGSYGGFGYMSWQQFDRGVAWTEENLPAMQKDLNRIVDAQRAMRAQPSFAMADRLGLRDGAFLRAPVIPTISVDQPYPGASWAGRIARPEQWADLVEPGRANLASSVEVNGGQLAAWRQAARAGYWQRAQRLSDWVLSMALGTATLLLVVNLIGAVLGRLASRIRRRRTFA